MTAATSTRAPGLAGLRAIAATITAIGGLALWQSLRIPDGGGYNAVGPDVFPLIVSGTLIFLGAAFLATTTVRPDAALVAKAAAERAATHWPTPIALVAALIAYAALLAPVGYVIATALFLPVSARLLGSKALRRDILVGLVVSVVVYVVFTTFLGVRLPPGLLAGLPVLG